MKSIKKICEYRVTSPPAVVAESVGPILNSDTAYGYLEESFEGLDREHFKVLWLNTKMKPIGMETVSIGTLNATLVSPGMVMKGAILAGAYAIMLAHNHPSGDRTPSAEDVTITRRIIDAGAILGIDVVDHLIVGGGGYRSMCYSGDCDFKVSGHAIFRSR